GPASVYGGFAHADNNTISAYNDSMSAGSGHDYMTGDVYVHSMYAAGYGGNAAAYGGNAEGGFSYGGNAAAYGGNVENINKIELKVSNSAQSFNIETSKGLEAGGATANGNDFIAYNDTLS